ncbi:hypothetical protein EJ06DRAFT_474359 [Trichodelitschia bisporula]|uniref:Rhodopsin domain-containing protein n=1 Tax=Trichodelitschia bisporula TaxID=703511 RepID=A0A6G1I1T2_9PEZI|nr:hypothetical protein EJ06DRAFT_474359 [Trichodelitschia bisporula]
MRFSPMTQDDHAGVLWIASLLAGIYAVLSLLVRTFIKRKCFGIDDWMCAAATVVAVASLAAFYVALHQGLGESSSVLDATHLRASSQSLFASRIASILSLCLSKCSVVCLIRRLFSDDMQRHRLLCDINLGIMALWACSSIVALSVRCSPQDLLQPRSGRCEDQLLRWRFIGVFDAVTEVMIVILSSGLVWRLQMRMGLKLRVVFAFVFRLPLVAVAILHIIYLSRTRPPADISMLIVPALICEQAELTYSLISATIPNLKGFLMSFDTSMMMDVSFKVQSSAQSTAPSERERERGREPYRIESISSRAPRAPDAESPDFFLASHLRPDPRRKGGAPRYAARWPADPEVPAPSAQGKSGRRDVRWRVGEAITYR